MKDMKKYEGIIPAFYACYDENGEINPAAVRELTRWFIQKGVKGLYVGGSSGECIYQSVAERKLVLENVMEEARGKLTVIAHIACNNTADSQELARHAESLGVGSHVMFTGGKPWEEIGKYYQLGNVFCSASVSETQGLTFAEAMAVS